MCCVDSEVNVLCGVELNLNKIMILLAGPMTAFGDAQTPQSPAAVPDLAATVTQPAAAIQPVQGLVAGVAKAMSLFISIS